jgi:hypothetical protein
LAIEEELKSTVSMFHIYLEKSTKIISEAINSISNDPKKQLELLKNLANNVVKSSIK